ncbi:MAG: Ig-like domain-containing protein [Bacteroidia bacterium]|nr:Ig-like domain-containing protein [Bacteroidia bacterium]
MKKIICFIIFLGFTNGLLAQKSKQVFVSTDIDNFWITYDKIIATKDSAQQIAFLKELYLDRGSEGLKGIIEVRNYSEKEFIDWITQNPKFWNSIRPNTLKVKSLYPDISTNIKKLKEAYPDLKPSIIYFTIGAFRAGGTIQGNKVLIGSELSLADKTTVIDELPGWRQTFYKTQHPIKELPLLCTHEYIHTQQKEMVENLLSMCLYEGVAEFISCKVTNTKSDAPAIEFGKANQKIVVDKFVTDLFIITNNYNWLWGENKNELKVRDLGYYIGYEICERYYNLSKDKAKAIKELIELDYTNEKEVERIVNSTKLLPKTLEELYNEYENQRPKVLSIIPFENGNQKVKAGVIQISINFSEEMDPNHRGFDYGPLGENFIYKFKQLVGWSNNNKTITIEVEIEPNKQYQALITNRFRNKNGIALKPYLIDFKTVE